jgi:hypothetical protein
MYGMPKQSTPQPGKSRAAAADGAVQDAVVPSNARPWEDRNLTPQDRLEAYKGFVFDRLADIQSALQRSAGDLARQVEIKDDPESQRWVNEGEWLRDVSAEDFCIEIDRRLIPELLGKNFLGAEAWRSQKIDVGEAPPIPSSITRELLESECPLHRGKKIKDTHLLVLVPKSVNGKPYTALELDKLCAMRKGSGEKLIYDGKEWANTWKSQPWASTPQSESEWLLIPKSDPDPEKVSKKKHFRSKRIAAQQTVHDTYYPDYREVKAVELMTAALLHDLVNGERLLDGYYLRCQEKNASGGRVCVGFFFAHGLVVHDDFVDRADDCIGRALARKSRN